MSSLDGKDLFGSGPHSVRAGAWERQMQRRPLPGLDGELLLDMGLRSRAIEQQGRLTADSASELEALLSAITQRDDGQLHILVDGHGRTFENVLIELFAPTTPLNRGRQFWCDYTLRYRQVP